MAMDGSPPARGPEPGVPFGNTTASSGFSRGSTPAIVRPSGSTADMSLLLCTARSMSPPSSASSISLTNRPLPPISDSGRSWRRSPSVLMTTMRQRGPPAAGNPRRDSVGLPQGQLAAPGAETKLLRMIHVEKMIAALSSPAGRALEWLDAPAFWRAIASSLNIRLLVREREQSRQCFAVGADRLRVVERLELLGRRQQQFLDNQVRDLVDPRARFRRERRPLRVAPLH